MHLPLPAPEVLVSSQGEAGGGVLRENQRERYGVGPSLAGRGIWSSGRKEGPLEGHKGGEPPDPRVSGHVGQRARLRANKGTFLGRKPPRGSIASFSSRLSVFQWPLCSLGCKHLPLYKTRGGGGRPLDG